VYQHNLTKYIKSQQNTTTSTATVTTTTTATNTKQQTAEQAELLRLQQEYLAGKGILHQAVKKIAGTKTVENSQNDERPPPAKARFGKTSAQCFNT
jgi:hypothetical protein